MATYRKTLSSNQYYEVILNVSQTSQNIANNTSNISWNLQVRKTYGSGFWGADGTASTWAVSIDGTNVSSSSGSYDFRGGAPLTKTIASGTRTITHAGDGSKSIAVSGYWKDNVNGLGSATASGTMALSTIPRATTLSAFSFASHLKNGVANTINYTVSRKSGNFRHQIKLMDGSTTVLSWDNISSDGASTITLTASNVNTLLTRMPTSTTKTFTLRIATRSGVNGGWIGSAVTRTATGTVHADVKPVLTYAHYGISGSRIDKATNTYIQGYTKVMAEFNRTAGYGSSIKASTVTVQRTDGLDTQVISGISGTTANPLSHSGSYRVVYKTTDERGRSESHTSGNFTVTPYSPPSITGFTVKRNDGAPATVKAIVTGVFSTVGSNNTSTLGIQVNVGNVWTDIGTKSTSNNGSISLNIDIPNQSITSSYSYRAVLSDSLGGRSESLNSVSTQQVVMDVYRDQGVGIGRMYDSTLGGSLQVGGISELTGGMRGPIVPTRIWSGASLNWILEPGFYFCPLTADARTIFGVPTHVAFSLIVEGHAGVKQTFTTYEKDFPETWVRNQYSGVWGNWHKSDAPTIGHYTTLINGWGNYAGGYAPVYAHKFHNGNVIINGMLHGGSSTHGNILQLPENMRPPNREIFGCYSSGGIRRVDIQTNGFLFMTPHVKDDWLSLSCISFMSPY